jgi:hypothetical protein
VSAAAPDIKKLYLDFLMADTTLTNMLAAAGNPPLKKWSVQPNARQKWDSETPAPYIYIGGGGTLLMPDLITETYEFWIGVYDEHDNGYWAIDRIHRRIYDISNNFQLVNPAPVPPLVARETLQGIIDPLERQFISEETQDNELNKLLKFARYRTWLVG